MNKASKLPTDRFVEIIEQSIDVLVELSDKLKAQSDHTRYRQLKTTQSKETLIDLVFIPIRIYLKGPFVPLDESEENLKNAYSEYCAQLRGFVLEDLTQHLPGSGVPDKLDEVLEEVFGIMGKTMFNPKESKHDALFEELCNCMRMASDEMRDRIGDGQDRQKVLIDGYTDVGKKQLRSAVGKPKERKRSDFRTQEQVAKDTGFTRKTINKWEREQTSDDSYNTSNKFGYFKSLRTDPEKNGPYRIWARMVSDYKKVKNRKITFVAYKDDWWKHNQEAIKMLHP